MSTNRWMDKDDDTHTHSSIKKETLPFATTRWTWSLLCLVKEVRERSTNTVDYHSRVVSKKEKKQTQIQRTNPWRMSEFTCVQLLYICLNLLVLLTFLFSNCVFDLQSYKIQVYNIDSRFLFIVIHSIGYIPELYNISL